MTRCRKPLAWSMMLLWMCMTGCRVGQQPRFFEPGGVANHSQAGAEVVHRVPAADGDPHEVRLAAYQAAFQDLPPPSAAAAENADPEVMEPPGDAPLTLPAVVFSVTESYPLLIDAYLERAIAGGRELSTWGEFDLSLKAFGSAAPEGFYENYRNGVALEQPLFAGGYLYGGYKIGDGDFQPWFKERETDEGGEFAVGFGLPLLKDRVIDKRRAQLFKAALAREAVEPRIRLTLIEFVRAASYAYWDWVAAGRQLDTQRQLLELARDRVEQIQQRIDAGDLAKVVGINNQQLIASRETKLIDAERKLQQAAIKLSLFFRNAAGEPIVPEPALLPGGFPDDDAFEIGNLDADIAQAVAAFPGLSELSLQAEQAQVELERAANTLLPKLDARLLASKDVGAPASSSRNKTPFELEVGLYGEVPLQRRTARGEIESARGKLNQIEVKRQFVVNKVTASVQSAHAAWEAARGQVERAELSRRLAGETLELGREQFRVGDIDLIALNIYEQAANDAELLLIEARLKLFKARADYRAALSLDPLD